MSEQTVLFSLEKDVVFSLDKVSESKDWYVGLSWTPAINEEIDLDAVLIAVGEDGKVFRANTVNSVLFYNNHGRGGANPQPFEITEDNRDGEEIDNGFPDDEAILIYGDKVASILGDGAKELRCFVTFHEAEGRSLTDVSEIKLTVAPLVNGRPDLTKSVVYDVHDIAGEGALMAKFGNLGNGKLDLTPIGEQCGNLAQIFQSHDIGIS